MIYDRFIYITPPRAEKAIPSRLLFFYEQRGFICQIKKNGTNSVIFVSPDKEVFAYNRHGERHKQWHFTEKTNRIFRNLPGRGWYVINAELIHAKVKGMRDINYIHDILVEDGVYLNDETYAQRYARLARLFLNDNSTKMVEGYWILDDHTWLARNFRSDFKKIYDSLTSEEDEGLVLKDICGKMNSKGWTVKCRVSHKNYSF